jgi:hypothetical protein
MKKIYILSCLAVSLSSCSAEYVNNKAICSQKAFSMYPVNRVLSNITRYKSVKIPSGYSSCTSYHIGTSVNTNCQEFYTSKLESYVEPAIIDINERQRKNLVRNCVASACLATHNNEFCW